MNLYIGLMSGTSMDGIDAALVDLDTHELLDANNYPYSKEVTSRLRSFQEEELHSLASICQLNTLIGRDFAEAVNQLLKKTGMGAEQIKAIGSHGQTVCHDAYSAIPYTLQLGCPHTIAEKTGITVVADFRTRDLVAGGQGAPFAPIYHQALFASNSEDIAVLNIGGIANITLLLKEGGVKGWDVGPGNCLMDAWVNHCLNQSFDALGQWAASGSVIPELVDQLLTDPFFSKPAPKSIGKEYFSLKWLRSYFNLEKVPANDIQASLLEFTARGISEAVKQTKVDLAGLYVCGGGVHNTALIQRIRTLLPECFVKSTAEKEISPDYLEAMLFAWLASKTMAREPIDLTEITGSQHPIIAGVIYP